MSAAGRQENGRWGFHAVIFLIVATVYSITGSTREVEVVESTISELQQALEQGHLTSVQLVEEYMARIETYDQQNN